MGTRADFYVGKNEEAEWIGSIAYDGYLDGIDDSILQARSETEFREAVEIFLKGRSDSTFPDRGWPWPWEDSATTDCSYWFFDNQVFDEVRGAYVPVARDIETNEQNEAVESGEKITFPNMKDRMNVRFDEGSGILLIGPA